MATSGWGVDPTIANGVVKTGTTAEDVRKVWGALYTPGVISGCIVVPSSTNLSYTVGAGVVAIQIATGEVVMAPVDRQTVLSAVTTSGTRKDIIWARQNMPGTESNSLVEVGVSTTLPARAVALGTYTTNAGNTKASQYVVTGSVNYSIPYGSTGSILHSWRDTSNDTITAGTSAGHGSFYLPTDRRIQISVDACLSSNLGGLSPYDPANYTEARYAPYVDGVRLRQWFTPGLGRSWGMYHFEDYFELQQGQHTAYLGFDRQAGPAYPRRHYAGENLHPGTTFVIRDAGVVK